MEGRSSTANINTMATMQLPDDYQGRGRVQGSSWQSPDQILAEQEQKAKEDQAKAVTFEEFKSRDGQVSVFRQTPFDAATHKRAKIWIEMDADKKAEKVVMFFHKHTTCGAFCDLVRRQILGGVLAAHELELFLAQDDGTYDDQSSMCMWCAVFVMKCDVMCVCRASAVGRAFGEDHRHRARVLLFQAGECVAGDGRGQARDVHSH